MASGREVDFIFGWVEPSESATLVRQMTNVESISLDLFPIRLLQSHIAVSTSRIHILRGSILVFQHPNGAIVNATNEICVGGPVWEAGGEKLQDDRDTQPRLGLAM